MGQKQLTEEKREILERLFMQGRSFREIGRIMGYSHVTISREFQKGTRDNDGRGYYCCRVAQDRATRRRKAASSKPKKYPEKLLKYIRENLRRYWSPELVVGRLSVDFPHDDSMRISFKTIYRWINAGTACHKEHLWGGFTPFLRLKRQGKKFGKKSERKPYPLPELPSIEERPHIVDSRERFGDWEADLIRGHRGQGYLVTLVERKSNLLVAAPCPSKRIEDVNHAMIKALSGIHPKHIQTITVDRGKEFYGYKDVENQLEVQLYFCHPYSPHERGQNEQANGLLRQFFPKRKPLTDISDSKLKRAVALINNRPKKKFNYRTTVEILTELGLNQVVTFA